MFRTARNRIIAAITLVVIIVAASVVFAITTAPKASATPLNGEVTIEQLNHIGTGEHTRVTVTYALKGSNNYGNILTVMDGSKQLLLKDIRNGTKSYTFTYTAPSKPGNRTISAELDASSDSGAEVSMDSTTFQVTNPVLPQ